MLTRSGVAVALLVLLAGCSAQPAPDSNPAEPAPPGDTATDDCVVGTWNLDVPTYGADSQAYLSSLGIPVDSFTVDGAGTLTFTPDGLVAADIALDTVATVGGVPLTASSGYTASGDWSRTGDDSIQFDNWAKVVETDDIPPAVDLPQLDVSQLAGVTAACSATELSLTGPGAPLTARWTR